MEVSQIVLAKAGEEGSLTGASFRVVIRVRAVNVWPVELIIQFVKSGLATLTLNGTLINPFPVSMGEWDKIQGPFATMSTSNGRRVSPSLH